MDKRDGGKGRRPEFCAPCSKAMLSYITTVKDFLDKVVEDIDLNTPSTRRDDGILARMRVPAEGPVQDSSDGRKRSSQRSSNVEQFSASGTQPQIRSSPVKGSLTARNERKSYTSNANRKKDSSEPFKSHVDTGGTTAQSEVILRGAQNSEITSRALSTSTHSQQPFLDTHIYDDLSDDQPFGPPPNHSSPATPLTIEHSSGNQMIHQHFDVESSNDLPNKSSVQEFSDPTKDKPAHYSPSSIDSMLPIDHPQPEDTLPATNYKHPPPLYSDHLAIPLQPEQAPLPIDEPSLPDGPFPTTWVEDMISVCDIPLLLPPGEEREAYVTMATNSLTAIGSLVLGNSLRLSGTNRTLVVLITDEITEELRNLLASVFHLVQPINSLEPSGSTKLALLEQPELGINYSKLLVWRLTQFDKCIYISPDTLVIQNCDELFQRNELSAVPDIGWPDFFNAGVFVYVPSDVTFWDLVNCAETKGSFDGGDQGLLNFYFRSWTLDINKRLPFIYNLMANVSYTYGPAFVRFGGNAKIVHFFGTTKPWNVQFNIRTGQLAPYSGVHPTFARYVQYWLSIFAQCVLPLFSLDIQRYTTMHGYVNAADLARVVTGQAESAITFSPPSFRRYLDVPENVAFPAEKVQSILLRRPSVDEAVTSEEEEEEIVEEKMEEDKEAEALANLNRMHAWEQGRIDYMGEDSSDKIMKKLDRFIKKGSRLS